MYHYVQKQYYIHETKRKTFLLSIYDRQDRFRVVALLNGQKRFFLKCKDNDISTTESTKIFICFDFCVYTRGTWFMFRSVLNKLLNILSIDAV